MKKVVLSIGAAAIIVLAAINVNIALKSEGISKSTMANVVALADSENPGSGENGATGTKRQIITSTREVLETYTRHSDGARCEKYVKTTVSHCEDGGTSLCAEYTTTEEGISCTVFS